MLERYTSSDEGLNWFHRLAALRLAKECSEEIYTLTKDGPFVRVVEEYKSNLKELNENRDTSIRLNKILDNHIPSIIVRPFTGPFHK